MIIVQVTNQLPVGYLQEYYLVLDTSVRALYFVLPGTWAQTQTIFFPKIDSNSGLVFSVEHMQIASLHLGSF